MNSIMAGILGQLDYKVVYIVVAVLVISAILAIIKKAIKIAVLVVIIALGTSYLGPMAKDFQNKYKFDVTNGVATIQVDGKTVKVDKSQIKDAELTNEGVKGYNIKLTYKDGGLSYINIPTFMVSGFKSYVQQYGVPTKISE